ncbi:MAG TPA: diacylglycerol kinase family protein [Candidatus Levybacteria bacterium]|nr:diacylglycerol kinase family protein [Candidatus Levybacteria bacterium]
MDIKKTLRSFRYAWHGFVHIWQQHQNIRFHMLMAVIAIVLSYVLKISYVEYLFVLITIFFVIISEMMNTAIEEMTNLITTDHKKEAKIAKDVAAAAVFLSAAFSLIVGAIIFLPRIFSLF